MANVHSKADNHPTTKSEPVPTATPANPTPSAPGPLQTSPPPAASATTTQETPAAANTVDERYRMVKVDDAGSAFAWNDNSKAGVSVKRIDFIRAAHQIGKKGRGAIAQELTRLTGKKVAYQIVFSATKGLPGGAPKENASTDAAAGVSNGTTTPTPTPTT